MRSDTAVRAERLRVMLDPWCPHHPDALEGMGGDDLFLALGCVEARQQVMAHAWLCLAYVLDAIAGSRHTDPAEFVGAVVDGTAPVCDEQAAHLIFGAGQIAWDQPHDPTYGNEAH